MQIAYVNEERLTVNVLKCNDGKKYVGVTKNLERRLESHAKGYVKFTKSRLPINLVVAILFESSIRAYDFERYLKSGSGIAFMNKRFL